MRLRVIAMALVGVAVGASDASARSRHRYTPPPAPYARPAYDGSAYSAAEINRVLTERAQHEPGLATELFPDFRQTATGGPSGGFPGSGL